MTTIWKSGVSDDWTNAADWSFGVPKAKQDAVINASGVYTVTISSADVAHSLTIDAAGATLSETTGGNLTMAGGLTVDAGTVILDGVNSFTKQTRLIGGALELGNSAALGASDLAIDGGALVGTASETLSNSIVTNGSFTLGAAHGDVVKLAGQTILNMHNGDIISFGQSGDDGVFIWDPLTLGVAGTGYSVDINAGTLRDANGSLNEVLSAASSVNMAAGVSLDVHGNAETVKQLTGAGAINSSLASGALTVDDGVFSGTVSSAVTLTIDHSLILTDATIDGNVVNNGTIDINEVNPGTSILDGTISGSGSILVESGDSSTTGLNGVGVLSGNNTYSGGTTLAGAILEISGPNAAGTGEIVFAPFSGSFVPRTSELIGTATETLSNQIVVDSLQGATFMAAHGTTLTLNAGEAWTIGADANLVFGSSTNDGMIVWDTPAGSTNGGHGSIEIAGGTLRAGDSNFQTLLETANSTSATETLIATGATLDVAGSTSTIYDIQGKGKIENTGAATTVTLVNGEFTGTIVGAITLDIGEQNVFSNVILGGHAANFGTIDIGIESYLRLLGPSSANIVLSRAAQVDIHDAKDFTGSISNLQLSSEITFDKIAHQGAEISYSGDTAGGTLTVSNASEGVSYSVQLVGNYTADEFRLSGGKVDTSIVLFIPPASASTAETTSTHTDSFDFRAAAAPHVAAGASVTHLRGVHAASDALFTHDMTEAMHAHGPVLDHFAHGLFAHGHAIPEALA